MNNMKKPQIRFKGFTDDWEQRKLGELGKARSGIGFPDAEQGGKEGVPFYKVSDMNNVGNEHEMVAANNHVTREQIARKGWKPIDEVPAIFFAKVGAAVLLNRKRLCRFPFLLDNNTMAYSIDGSALDADFAITLFDTIDLTSLVQVGALPSYNSGDVEDIDVVIPEMSEQRKIGTYFKRIDSLITLHQRKYEKLQIIKKSMLENCFPKNGEKVPKIRFSGFTGDWEQRKLAELVTRYEDPVETPHDGYIRLGIRSHAKGTFHEYVEPGHELETAQMHRVAANKLIFNITFAWEHAVAITTEDDAGKLVSHRFPQFSLSELLRPEFLKYVILDEGFHHKLYLASPGGAGRNRVLKVDEALDYPIFFPSVEEQHKIGEFLNQLNDLITLHQSELEKLRKIKESMLNMMFVQEEGVHE